MDDRPVIATPTDGEESDGRIRRSRATRKALLEAARQIFLVKGYRDATVDDINDAAGTGHGTFYGHFKGKEDILMHVFDDLTEAFYAIAERQPYKASSVSDVRAITVSQISAGFRLALKWQRELRVLQEAMGESPTIRAYWEDGVLGRLIRRTEQDILYSQAHGWARPTEARLGAKSLIALVMYYLWQLVMGYEPADQADKIAETVTDLYMYGMYGGGG